MENEFVLSWCRFVAACNDGAWERAGALLADDFRYALVVGALYAPQPARTFDKGELLAWMQMVQERQGWTNQIRSIAALAHTVVVNHDNVVRGVARPGHAMVRFGTDGRISQMYEVAPAP